jgi:hypothetical protein
MIIGVHGNTPLQAKINMRVIFHICATITSFFWHLLVAVARRWFITPLPAQEPVVDDSGWIEEVEEPKPWLPSLGDVKNTLFSILVTDPLQRHTCYPLELYASPPSISIFERVRWAIAAAIEQKLENGMFSQAELDIPEEFFNAYLEAKKSRIWKLQPYLTNIEILFLSYGNSVLKPYQAKPPPPPPPPPSPQVLFVLRRRAG